VWVLIVVLLLQLPLLLRLQIQSEFPEILPIKESLIKYVFEPNAAKVSRRAGWLTVARAHACMPVYWQH
jgi:hypothetical protein